MFNKNKNKLITIGWIGDVSLNGLFCDPLCHTNLTKSIKEISSALKDVDILIVNWESPLWGDGEINYNKWPRLCTTEMAAKTVLPLGIDVALLANNHTYDCMHAGFVNTLSFLKRHQILCVGAGDSAKDSKAPLKLKINNVKVVLLNYVAEDTNPSLPIDDKCNLNILMEEQAIQDVKRLKANADIVLVALHWGEREMVKYPTVEQRRFCRGLAKTGASAVVCAHAHRLQGCEITNDSVIVYGLGNFLFSCYGGKPGRNWPKEAREGAIVKTTFYANGVAEFEHIFFKQIGQRLKLSNNDICIRKQNKLNKTLEYNDFWLNVLLKFHIVCQVWILWPLRFIKENGGLIRSLLNIKPKHVKELLKSIFPNKLRI